ncbi:MAG: anaerobic ribonucleoside-triphosphate reductase activating protein [Candidatus Pacearchaeota archaeon]|nr:anaerobic ribonucleoside-triphosphate reductase activating protein [Candidatus Pacearchaeota archaeon]
MSIYKNIKGFVPTSLVDWDGKVSAIIFVGGCNFRCKFCSNEEIVIKPENVNPIDWKKMRECLEKNKEFIDGVVISGGEPTLYDDLENLCKEIKEMGFLVKLDTNGTNPDLVEKLIKKDLIDYVAMDIKTKFEKYKEITNSEIDIERLKRTIEIVKNFGNYEFRITLYPKITKEDLLEIAKYLKEIGANKAFFLQQFKNEKCLDKEAEKIKPYSKQEVEKMFNSVKNFFEKSGLRNV